jgi:hypothetical protein
VVALAERGELALIEEGYAPLDASNEVARRLRAAALAEVGREVGAALRRVVEGATA